MASAGANLVDVEHVRDGLDLPVGEVVVHLVLETRGREHAREVVRTVAEAGYSAIACQIGFAQRYYPDYAGVVPLILKLNGRTEIPPNDNALSPCNSSV